MPRKACIMGKVSNFRIVNRDNRTGLLSKIWEVLYNEDDISTEEASQSQGTWFQKENGNKVGQKDFSFKKTKGQKIIDCVI